MPVATHSIVFARIVPSELNIVTAENNNVIDLALQRQLKDSNGNDLWQARDNFLHDLKTGSTTIAESDLRTYDGNNLLLNWSDFKDHFYGGGDGDFGLSQIVGRRLTMIGVTGEYANGISQVTSSLTHMSDRGSGDASISGVSVMNDVIDSIVLDLGLPHEAWDSCSYMNVVNNLQDVHTLEDVTRVQGKLQQSCSLSMSQLIHEISSNYDENKGNRANSTDSAVYQLYNAGLDTAIELAMNSRRSTTSVTGAGGGVDAMHDLVLSVMFKNSTPGVRNVEFRIHMLVSWNGEGVIGPFAATEAAVTIAAANLSAATTTMTVTSAAHGLLNGDTISVTSSGGTTPANNVVTNAAVTVTTANAFTYTTTVAAADATADIVYTANKRGVDLTLADSTALSLNGVST